MINPPDPDEPTPPERLDAPGTPDVGTSRPSARPAEPDMPAPSEEPPESSEEPGTLAAAEPSGESPGPVALRVANGPLAAPVLSRVVSMFLVRAACPLDRLDDALILCDAVSAHAPTYSRDGHIAFTLTSDARTIELRVAELSDGGASELLEDAQLPDVGNVIERFSDGHRIESAKDGTGEALVLKLDLS